MLELEVKDMTDGDVRNLEQQGLLQDPEARRRWNLTNLGLFRRDFRQLVETVAPILPADPPGAGGHGSPCHHSPHYPGGRRV